MEVHHKPKPFHGLREFLKEYGIIVLSVLTALALEQTVEWWHWRERVHEAAEAMRLELQTDDGPQAIARVAIEKCLDGQLDALQKAVEDGLDRAQIHRLAAAYSPPRRTWDAQAWQAATSSQVAAHIPAPMMIAWSTPYNLMPTLAATNGKEHADRVGLLAGRRGPGPASPAEEERWLVAIENLRYDNEEMAYFSLALLAYMQAEDSAVPRPAEQRVLDEMRRKFGNCVVAPDVSTLPLDSQLNAAGR
jgi:hypothetical protein